MQSSFGAGAFAAFAWWSSIVLASMPYVVGGVLAGRAIECFARRGGIVAVLAAFVSPGCDCSLPGIAAAMHGAPPPLAGFALMWSAGAGPIALLATHSVLGDRVLAARLAGTFVTASLTALAWCGRMPARVSCAGHGTPESAESAASALGNALRMSCLAASAATLVLACGHALHAALSSPAAAAIAGALISPCSTSDAVLARVLSSDRAQQAAFVIAAQCIDVRQMLLMHRSFGGLRALLALGAGCCGCAVAALVAR